MDSFFKKAAVLVPCYEKGGESWVVLTRRTLEVDHHKGQICFPGGASDPEDESLWVTALRETYEEIGLKAEEVTLVRELKERGTPSGFYVSPFVASVRPPLEWRINHREIDEIFSVPLSFLKNPKNLQWVKRHREELTYLDPLFVYAGHEIWGLTARILCEFLGHPFPEGSLG